MKSSSRTPIENKGERTPNPLVTRWKEAAKMDGVLAEMVPSDIRLLVAEIKRLEREPDAEWGTIDAISDPEEYPDDGNLYSGNWGITVFFHSKEDADAFADAMLSEREKE